MSGRSGILSSRFLAVARKRFRASPQSIFLLENFHSGVRFSAQIQNPQLRILFYVGPLGIEPSPPVPKTGILPIYDGPFATVLPGGIARDSHVRRHSHEVWASPRPNFLLKIRVPAFASSLCSREESNLHQGIRSSLFCPLNYRSISTSRDFNSVEQNNYFANFYEYSRMPIITVVWTAIQRIDEIIIGVSLWIMPYRSHGIDRTCQKFQVRRDSPPTSLKTKIS